VRRASLVDGRAGPLAAKPETFTPYEHDSLRVFWKGSPSVVSLTTLQQSSLRSDAEGKEMRLISLCWPRLPQRIARRGRQRESMGWLR
jgi:hypothetical protein